jgi:predicted nuclease of predicted toxin-antitoxin system
MNLSLEWVELLRKSGVDAIHWSRIGETNASDSELFARARAEGWVILTQDLDFSQILFETAANGPSTVMLRLADELNLEGPAAAASVMKQLM